MKGLKQEFKTQTVSCILIDKDNQTLWMVIGTSGLIKYNLHNHTWQKIPKEKYFPSESRIPSIIKMTRLSNGAIWFGTYNDGIFEYQETTAGVHHTKNSHPPPHPGCLETGYTPFLKIQKRTNGSVPITASRCWLETENI